MNPRVSGSPGDGGGHCHPANAASRPLTSLAPPPQANSAEHAFRKRLKREKFLIAIENKTEEVSPANVDQVRGYDTKLRDKYKNRYRVRSVLLTASRDGSFAQQGFVHVSWASVHREISALHQAGEFRPRSTPSFGSMLMRSEGESFRKRWFRIPSRGYWMSTTHS